MKKITVLLASLAMLFTTFAQETTTLHSPVTRADYLDKAKAQKKAAIVLVSVGGAFIIIGTATAVQSFDLNFDNYNSTSNSTSNNDVLSGVLIIGGLAAIAGSVGLFIASHHNKKKALRMSLQNEQVLLFPQQMKYKRSMPAWGLHLDL